MLRALKEKVIPSLIAMILVGAFTSFVTAKVTLYRVEALETDLELKVSKEAFETLVLEVDKKASGESVETICTTLELKANKDIQNLIWQEVKEINKDIKSILNKLPT